MPLQRLLRIPPKVQVPNGGLLPPGASVAVSRRAIFGWLRPQGTGAIAGPAPGGPLPSQLGGGSGDSQGSRR